MYHHPSHPVMGYKKVRPVASHGATIRLIYSRSKTHPVTGCLTRRSGPEELITNYHNALRLSQIMSIWVYVYIYISYATLYQIYTSIFWCSLLSGYILPILVYISISIYITIGKLTKWTDPSNVQCGQDLLAGQLLNDSTQDLMPRTNHNRT